MQSFQIFSFRLPTMLRTRKRAINNFSIAENCFSKYFIFIFSEVFVKSTTMETKLYFKLVFLIFVFHRSKGNSKQLLKENNFEKSMRYKICKATFFVDSKFKYPAWQNKHTFCRFYVILAFLNDLAQWIVQACFSTPLFDLLLLFKAFLEHCESWQNI